MISVTGQEPFEEQIQAISDFVCGDYELDGCDPAPIPPCTAPPTLACVNGQCTIQ
jgi:hypothetical protein